MQCLLVNFGAKSNGIFKLILSVTLYNIFYKFYHPMNSSCLLCYCSSIMHSPTKKIFWKNSDRFWWTLQQCFLACTIFFKNSCLNKQFVYHKRRLDFDFFLCSMRYSKYRHKCSKNLFSEYQPYLNKFIC